MTIGGRTMDEFDRTMYRMGDVLLPIGGTELWTVVADRGFFYALEKGAGFWANKVSLPKKQVNMTYVKVNDILNMEEG